MEAVTELSEYELDRGKPMPSKTMLLFRPT